MSNTDSFIEEVTEEVRRDKLFKLMRRWGWLAVLIVLVLVGGAAWNEWRKATERATAQGFGDAVIAASQSETTQIALQDLPTADANQQLLKSLLIAGAAAGDGDRAQTAATLQELADTGDLPPLYRQLALLKAQMAGGTGDASRDARILEELATPGGAFRPLAMEQQALRLAETGDSEGAIALMRQITAEAGVTDTLRRRALQVIVALGGDIDPA
jgi:hypothetical protein